eukprot:2401142-Lingulodinium_polyedra.AAC.1
MRCPGCADHIGPINPAAKRSSASWSNNDPNWLHTDGQTVLRWSILSMRLNQRAPPLWAAPSSTRARANS